MSDFNLGPFRINFRGEFTPYFTYRFLDAVTYNGGSYICINKDTIDGIAVTGVLPEGQPNSLLYWQCIAHKGDIGDNIYDGFLSVTNGVWDYSKSDKIIIPDNGESTITINNVYNGCCGMICTTKNLALPSNSDKSIDFNYINAGTNQYYMYTFVYGTNVITNTNKYIWNRTVITT